MTLDSVYLQPGECFFGQKPVAIETILGSCLGIVMWHPSGAACVAHCVLPKWDGLIRGREAHYVDLCLADMMLFFDHHRIARTDVDVKLFGGAQMLSFGPGRRTLSVGRQNLDAALQILRRERIAVTKQDVGGNRGRKIVVDTATGEVRVSYLYPSRPLVNGEAA